MFRPEVWALYREGLSFAQFGFNKFQKFLREIFHPTFKATLKQLKGDKHQLADAYYKNLTQLLDVTEVAESIERALQNPAHQKFERQLAQLRYLETDYANFSAALFPAFQELMRGWQSFVSPQKLEKVVSAQREQLDGMRDPLLAKLSAMESEALLMLNSCCTETFRIPDTLLKTALVDANVREDVAVSAAALLKEVNATFDFAQINITDLLLRHSFQIFAQFDPQSEQRRPAEKALEKLMSQLVGIELCSEDNRDYFIQKFLKQFTAYREAMELLFPQARELGNLPVILNRLAALLPSDSPQTALFRVKFGSFYSAFYLNVGVSGVLDISSKEIPFLQEQLLNSIRLIERIAVGRQQQIESILGQLIEHPESGGQLKPFWKLQLKVARIIFKKYARAYQISQEIKDKVPTWTSKEKFVFELKGWLPRLDVNLGSSLNEQLNILLNISRDNPDVKKVAFLIQETIQIHNLLIMMIRPVEQAAFFVPDLEEKKTVPEQVKREPTRKKRVEEELEREEIVIPTPTTPYKPTAFERSLEPLAALQLRDPLPLDNMEGAFSLFKRKEKMEQALQTQLYLMHLLEEEKDPELKPLCRGATELFRLHEMTQKLALAFFPIRETGRPHLLLDPNRRHLFTSLHDGVYLAQVLTKSEPLFGNKKSEPFLKDQEKVLKVSYWFSEERPEPNSAYDLMLPRCKEIWRKMEQQKAVELTCIGVVDSLWKMRALVQEQREVPVVELPELPPLRELLGKVVAPIVELAKSLDTHAKASMRAPLLFTNRHAEVQIGLLTSVMKDFLYKRGYSPDQELEGRPLKHSHNVLHLWSLLKSHFKENIEEQLTHFVGDPRYPFPNKTAISYDLVTSYELSRLRDIARTGFLDEEKVQLFKKYVLDFSLTDLKAAERVIEKQLQEHLERIEKKTRLAFVLAAKLSE